MAAGNFTFYHQGKLKRHDGTIDLLADTIVCMLLSTGYAPDAAAHVTVADLGTTEITDADYAPKVVTGFTSVIDAAGKITVDSANVVFGNPVDISAKWGVFVKRVGTAIASTDPLLGYVDLNTAGATAVLTSTNSEFAINTPSGFYSLT